MHLVLPIGCMLPLPIMATAVQSNYLPAFILPFVSTLIEATGPGFCANPDPASMGKAFCNFIGGVVIFGLLAALNTV